ncbi:FAS1 domain-containing protein SELMODRAFT_448915 [Punica granatum]|uniref:FAS1 domain-containing protein SELMODRAFT_448915 n=2 Tax=Punica granatum TaxID=22663 RepID=A0A6P8CE06_PUNGR|nr:FAS1 domain-containing protein SELMODRAFT_448915 [Punica granatum]PKI54594.1 hypothetical protein CRG98_025108 [Punica granatum]
MATYQALLLHLVAALVFSSAVSRDVPPPPPLPPRSRDVLVAVEEMKAASYFTFVTLINMTPPDLILGNVTFLMPDDRMLSKISLAQEDVSGFLLRHLIPSPMLLDHLQRIPTGSIIPTSAPGYIMRIDNAGRKSLSLNNVKLISPDICVAGSSIRCHGIGGVLPAVKMPFGSKDDTPFQQSPPSCSTASSSSSSSSSSNITNPIPPAEPLLPLPPPLGSTDLDHVPAPAPPFPHQKNSAATRLMRSFLPVVGSTLTFTVVAGFLAT